MEDLPHDTSLLPASSPSSPPRRLLLRLYNNHNRKTAAKCGRTFDAISIPPLADVRGSCASARACLGPAGRRHAVPRRAALPGLWAWCSAGGVLRRAARIQCVPRHTHHTAATSRAHDWYRRGCTCSACVPAWLSRNDGTPDNAHWPVDGQ